ncbi:hypothetical protein Bca101_043345 [Brassica carinata]
MSRAKMKIHKTNNKTYNRRSKKENETGGGAIEAATCRSTEIQSLTATVLLGNMRETKGFLMTNLFLLEL